MIRFIFKNTYSELGVVKEKIFTMTKDLPEIEKVLTEGSWSTSGCEFNSLIGIEAFDKKNKEASNE